MSVTGFLMCAIGEEKGEAPEVNVIVRDRLGRSLRDERFPVSSYSIEYEGRFDPVLGLLRVEVLYRYPPYGLCVRLCKPSGCMETCVDASVVFDELDELGEPLVLLEDLEGCVYIPPRRS